MKKSLQTFKAFQKDELNGTGKKIFDTMSSSSLFCSVELWVNGELLNNYIN